MPLVPVPIRAPGIGGLNLEAADLAGQPTHAQIAKNMLFDKSGRLASRKGYTNIGDLTGSADVEAIFVYDSSTGDSVISALGDALYEDTTDKQGSLTHTTAVWQFQNFNDKIVGAQNGQTMIVKSGTGNFAAIAAKGGGTVDASGNCVHSAFGRLWATNSEATTMFYSGLLDETEWPSATTPGDSGSVNLLGNAAAVRDGYDRIVAINHLDDKLVVFLENSIVIYSNPDDPSNLAIYRTINNIGCISRDSVQQVANDLIFLSRDGVRSLARAVIEDNFPLRDLSQNVRGELLSDISGTPSGMKAAYYPDEGLYILLTPGNRAWVFDFKQLQDGALPRVTTWDVPKWHSLYYHEGTLYIGQEGEYGQYSGYLEDGAEFEMEFKSIDVDLDNPNIKAIKKTTAAIEGGDGQTVTFTYAWDYDRDTSTAAATIPVESTAGVYGTMVYGTGTYGSGINRAEVQANPFGSGEVLAFGFSANVNNTLLAIEQMTHFVKLGRIAR